MTPVPVIERLVSPWLMRLAPDLEVPAAAHEAMHLEAEGAGRSRGDRFGGEFVMFYVVMEGALDERVQVVLACDSGWGVPSKCHVSSVRWFVVQHL